MTTGLMPIGGDVDNSAKAIIENGTPYIVHVRIVGVAALLFHRWSTESVAAKAASAKGSKTKKTDDVKSYVYRLGDGTEHDFIGLPGDYLRQSVINAAKYRQDPRSPRKSAMDLYKAGVLALTDLAPINGGVSTWDYEDQRRVTVQRNGVTRVRPAFKTGWWAEFDFLINLPEYIPPDVFLDVLVNAGRLSGVGDFRPTYGRFSVVQYECMQA